MSVFDSPFILPLALVAGVAAMAAVMAAGRYARSRRRVRKRVVEQPNSHYTSQLARESVTRHRWHSIDLERVHEINREEVVRLLDRVEAIGADTLRPSERVFLDHMADLTGTRSAPEPPRQGPQGAPELRPRTA